MVEILIGGQVTRNLGNGGDTYRRTGDVFRGSWNGADAVYIYTCRLQNTSWPLAISEQNSKVATQNLEQLGLNCMDGRPQ